MEYFELKKLAILRLKNDKFPYKWLTVSPGAVNSWGFWYKVTLEEGTVYWKKFKWYSKMYLSEYLFLEDKGFLAEILSYQKK